jgi:hypothetical protein
MGLPPNPFIVPQGCPNTECFSSKRTSPVDPFFRKGTIPGWMQGKEGCGRLPGRQVLKAFEVAHESSGAGSILDGLDAPPD